MGRNSISIEPERVHRLTLAELAAHDDACSDAMVDNAYFKSQIRKNKTKYFPLRIKEDEVPRILLNRVIVQKDLVAAEKEILRVAGLKRYRSTLKSKAEQANFLKHIRKYICMYQTDCPWEVSTTNRYTITTYEAAVTARQRIKQGQIIKYLVGTLVPLTIEESADLDHTNRNFSIVVSSRKKNSSIFLGPARFANHDCDANGRLVTRGSDAMEVIAMKNIDVGDEITVSYGDDYFGPGNADCLCHTCERLVRNGWAAAREISDSPRSSVLPSQEPSSPVLGTSKRKRDPHADGEPSILRPLKKIKAKPSPSKLQHSWTPTSSVDSDTIRVAQTASVADADPANEAPLVPSVDVTLSPPASPIEESSIVDQNVQNVRGVQQVHDAPHLTRRQSSSSKSTKDAKLNKMTARLLGNLPSDKLCPLSPASTANSVVEPPSHPATEAGSNVTGKVTIKIESLEINRLESDTIVVARDNEQSGMLSPATDDEQRELNAILTLKTFEVSKTAPLVLTDPSTVIPSIEPPVVAITTCSSAHITVKPLSEKVRIPGDYILTRKLLAQPHDRWVQCHNERCQGFFIQPNGYQTRRECPRCERHSMLYGFSWPKTDPDPRKILERSPGGRKNKSKVERSCYRREGTSGKGKWVEGGGDEEERVLDHRTVHRFVLPEDEKAITRRGLLNNAEQARSSRLDFDPVELHFGGRKRTESVGVGGLESTGERGSLTPDGEARRRSGRFVTRVGVYADV